MVANASSRVMQVTEMAAFTAEHAVLAGFFTLQLLQFFALIPAAGPYIFPLQLALEWAHFLLLSLVTLQLYRKDSQKHARLWISPAIRFVLLGLATTVLVGGIAAVPVIVANIPFIMLPALAISLAVNIVAACKAAHAMRTDSPTKQAAHRADLQKSLLTSLAFTGMLIGFSIFQLLPGAQIIGLVLLGAGSLALFTHNTVNLVKKFRSSSQVPMLEEGNRSNSNLFEKERSPLLKEKTSINSGDNNTSFHKAGEKEKNSEEEKIKPSPPTCTIF